MGAVYFTSIQLGNGVSVDKSGGFLCSSQWDQKYNYHREKI